MSERSVDELFVGSESTTPTGTVAVAVLDSVPNAVAAIPASTVNTTVVPAGMLTSWLREPAPATTPHVAAPVGAHVHVGLTSVAGSTSVTRMPSIRDGPGLVTVIEYVVGVPATTVDRPSVVTIDTSPRPLTVVLSVAVLSALFGSTTPGGASMLTVLVTAPS